MTNLEEIKTSKVGKPLRISKEENNFSTLTRSKKSDCRHRIYL